jgi:hypothetical protein
MKPSDVFEKNFPEQWAVLYPRIYEHSGAFHSPRDLALDLMGAFLAEAKANHLRTSLGRPSEHALLGASLLASLRVPTFFLSRDLLEALAQTRPPEAIAWKDMPLPFEAAAFIFPRGALKHSNSDEMSCLWYARLRKQQIYRNPFTQGFTYELDRDIFYFRGFLYESLESVMFGFSEITHPEIHAVDLSTYEPTDFGQSTKPLNGGDEQVLESAISLVLGALLVMLERPQLVTPGSFQGKHSRKGAEFWTPNIVGREYRGARRVISQQDMGLIHGCTGAAGTGETSHMAREINCTSISGLD